MDVRVGLKKAEHLRIDVFELWCWRRLLRVPWTARRSSQSILKEISLSIHWKDWCWSWNFDVKNQLIGKDPDAKQDWRQEYKEMTENEMVGWHHWLDGHVFEQAPGVGDGQGSPACCSPWGQDTTEQLNQTDIGLKDKTSTWMIYRKNSSWKIHLANSRSLRIRTMEVIFWDNEHEVGCLTMPKRA